MVVAGCGRVDFDRAAPSCAELAPTCGPDGHDSCCATALVPGGTFLRAYDVAADGDFNDTSDPATLSAFHLDVYEVTVARYRAFVDSGAYTQVTPPLVGAGAHPDIPGSGWDAAWNATLAPTTSDRILFVQSLPCAGYATWTDAPTDNDNRPINCMTWVEALAFCIWDGGYLPTEAEWNFAASGGDEQRVYAWSVPPSDSTIDPSRASYGDGVTCPGDGIPSCAITDILPVGTKPAGVGRWGQFDLTGNVSEWVLDSFDATLQTPCTNCAQLGAFSARGQRGGSFFRGAFSLRSAARGSSVPVQNSLDSGFRCARP
jgi:formylglycine-generating enzyme required for sulfatase activity